ncbi:MAG: SPFH domain-containing protein [Candidatus Moranbacteria bacterium]|nr:SPFH domain-containing protein [Candidatus Moranbacteria bacterium]
MRQAWVAMKPFVRDISARSLEKAKEISMNDSRGYAEGVVVTLGIGIVASLLVKFFGSWLLHPIAGTLLALITLVACILYFGIKGLRTIPVGFIAMKLWLGKRVEGRKYPEGVVWNWPKPIGDLEIKDGRDKPLNLPLTEVLTADNVPIEIDVALQLKITDINKNLSADKPEESLKNAAESDLRSIVMKLQSSAVAQEKQVIVDVLTSGRGPAPVPGTDPSPLEGLILKGLAESEQLWGIKVSQVRITHIRLPKKIEDARSEVQVQVANQAKETQQAIAEMTEARAVASQIKLYVEAGLLPQAAANLVQTERGKATRIIFDSTASPIENAGAFVGGILNQAGAQKPSQPSAADPEAKSQRRRNK